MSETVTYTTKQSGDWRRVRAAFVTLVDQVDLGGRSIPGNSMTVDIGAPGPGYSGEFAPDPDESALYYVVQPRSGDLMARSDGRSYRVRNAGRDPESNFWRLEAELVR